MTDSKPLPRSASLLASRWNTALVGCCLLAACGGGGAQSPAEPRAALSATRVTGPAPLAVMFDATQAGSGIVPAGRHAFHDVRYEFDFGHAQGQTWPVSGLPKHQQSGGPLAAHVFDAPGSYTVRVRATAAGGQETQAEIVVQVEDAATAFAGRDTICVSTIASYEGCPQGAARATALPTAYAGKRVLLRRGETFPAVRIRRQDDRVMVGAFGDGPKPRVAAVSIGGGNPTTAEFPDDITVMDLHIRDGIGHGASGSRILLYRNELSEPGGDNGITIGGALQYYVENGQLPATAYYHPREIFIVENMVRGNASKPFINLQGTGSRIALLGNDMGGAEQHTVRLFAAHTAVIAHNALRGRSSDGNRHALKLHSGGLGPYDDSYAVSRATWASARIVIADNLFGDPSDNNAWTTAVAPQNADVNSAEGIEDVVIERNRYVRGPRTNTELVTVGRRITMRQNTRVDGGTPNMNQGGRPYQNLPAEWQGPYFRQ